MLGSCAAPLLASGVDNDAVRANTAVRISPGFRKSKSNLRKSYPETDLQGHRDFAAVAAARQEHSVPVLEGFKAWLDGEKDNKRILPKSPIRSAFTYTLNQWDALCRYTEEGYLNYSNNLAERAVKVPAIGRKNYLFVASSNGGCRAAIHYSLVSTAKANGVEPYAWLRDIFTRLPYHRDGEATTQAEFRAAGHFKRVGLPAAGHLAEGKPRKHLGLSTESDVPKEKQRTCSWCSRQVRINFLDLHGGNFG